MPICGDGLRVAGEKCDAGSNYGCESDCSKPLPCDVCSGGTPIGPDTCTDQCILPMSLPYRIGWKCFGT